MLRTFIFIYLFIFLFIFFLSCSTTTPYDLGNITFQSDSLPLALNLPNPSLNGENKVLSFYYASIFNPRRKEYQLNNISVLTKTINISNYFNNIKYDYWGYGAKNVPINGKIWYPDKKGKFPLVLCVHGNHNPYDFSEFGYEYIGELLASRGMIFTTIDENFLNGRKGSENDARAIVVLEHAKQILSWNDIKNNPLYNKIDTDNIVLIGHSRGGEAVVIASIFNNMDYYPENKNIKFDWKLPIRAVISLAPVEGQYRPGGRLLTTPPDVDYLLIHGSHDGDVGPAAGLRFFGRGLPYDGHFRASFWIYGANHTQFNTSWAKTQDPNPTLRKFLLKKTEQQEISKILISSFLEIVFNRNTDYLTFLEDYRTGIDWLPQTLYISQFQDNKGTILANFEEDEDMETATLENWFSKGKGFSLWKEYTLPFIWSRNPENWFLFLKWSNKETISYKLSTVDNFVSANTLTFDIALISLYGREELTNETLDFSIIIETKNSEKIKLNFSDYYSLQALPEVWIFEFELPVKTIKYYMLQTVNVPFIKQKQGVNEIISGISSIEFKFDKTKNAYIVIDNIKLK